MTSRFGNRNRPFYEPTDELRGLDFVKRSSIVGKEGSRLEKHCVWLPPRRQRELTEFTNLFYSDILDEIIPPDAMVHLDIDRIRNIVLVWCMLTVGSNYLFSTVPDSISEMYGADASEDDIKDAIDDWYNEAMSDLYEVYTQELVVFTELGKLRDTYPVYDWINDIFCNLNEHIYDSYHGLLQFLIDEIRDVPGYHMFISDTPPAAYDGVALTLSICDFSIDAISDNCDMIVFELPVHTDIF